MKVGIVNYGMGNIGSVRRALEQLQAEVVIADAPGRMAGVDRIILPGVGAFGEGMARLREAGWAEALHEHVNAGTPLLGICLGMQMLGTSSAESAYCDGLRLIPGRVERLDALGCSLRIPHVGWNDVAFTDGTSLFDGIPQGTDFYFVHGYALQPDDAADACATVTYGAPMAAAVRKGHVFGTQFHPEKSSRAGRQILKNFLTLAPLPAAPNASVVC
jgi:imidazole glycerol-phosphate synthase subunit HisH